MIKRIIRFFNHRKELTKRVDKLYAIVMQMHKDLEDKIKIDAHKVSSKRLLEENNLMVSKKEITA